MVRLNGEKVLITGAARRSGRPVALAMAEAGASLLITYSNSRDDALVTQGESDKTPLRRNGIPTNVAEAVLFFAGATPFITGQVLTVDGGLGL